MDGNLYLALASRDSAKLEQFSSSDLLRAKSNRKNTPLHIAVQFGDIKCVENIFDKSPDLLRQSNSSGDTALHIAARNGLVEVVKFILDCDSKYLKRSYERLTRSVNGKGDTALHEAVRNGHSQIVELLTENDTEFEYYNAKNFAETPVYLATEAGFLDMVKKILDTCKSAACGGPGRRNALHAAILLDETDICKLLLVKKPELIREKDHSGWTPLHCAACTGAIQMIENMTEHCPDSWELLDNMGRNFLHVAVVHQQAMVVKYVLKSDKSVKDLLNEPDSDGNTPLHLAADSATEVFLLLVLDDRVNKNAMNRMNLTVRDIAVEKGEVMLPVLVSAGGILSRRRQIIMKQSRSESGNKQNTENKGNDVRLVVATLLTVTFTAGMTVLGGLKIDGPDAGTSILTRSTAFTVFVMSNAIAMALSGAVVFNHFQKATKKAMKQSIWVWRASIFGSFVLILISVVIAFLTGSYAVLSNSHGLAIASTVTFFYLILSIIFGKLLIIDNVATWLKYAAIKLATILNQRIRKARALSHSSEEEYK